MKIFIFLFFLLSLTNLIFSDDGSWNVLFKEIKGGIYSETDNKEITLEREVLKFGGLVTPTVDAYFQFKNVTDKSLKVEAGFPIKVKLSISPGSIYDKNYNPIENVYFLSAGKYGNDQTHIDIARDLLGDKLKYYKNEMTDGFTGQSDYYFTQKDLEQKKIIKSSDFKDRYKFKITQNGKDIKYDFVVVETAIEEYDLVITYHYHHILDFGPKETSIVLVSYYDNCFTGNSNMGYSMGSMYEWNYILGTGGTWKDKIKALYFILPEGTSPTLPKEFKEIGNINKSVLYLAKDYKPKKEDNIFISDSIRDGSSSYYLNSIWFEEPQYVEIPGSPVDSLLSIKSVSSNIKEKTTIYTESGVMKDIDYSALRMFDGVRESAWCEAAKDDGIGEWVEFEIYDDVTGVEIQNGFNKSFCVIEGKDIDTYYEKNNRVKTIEFVSKDGKTSKKINLEDIKDYEQFFEIELPKGVYKVYIRDIYKGSKWRDTCIGEIKFYYKSKQIEKIINEDSFFKKYFK